MRSKFPLHPDAITVTEDECHALWFAFQAVRRDYIMSFATGTERETAERFGLGFRHPGTEEAFVPTKKWNAFYLKLAELGLAALPPGESVRLLCGHKPDEHRNFLGEVIRKITASKPEK
ncbi:MAG: hypothetical protein HYT14_00015 [Candidatus Liptonbacteria bacterium]|nr:hypothetical protein [Candidatus Liptonbacteria bacterium]